MLITKNKQKELIKYIHKQYDEISAEASSEIVSCINYTIEEIHENKLKSKRFSLDSDILDFFVVVDIHSGKMDIVTWRTSECPEFKYNGKFPRCAKKHIIYLYET